MSKQKIAPGDDSSKVPRIDWFMGVAGPDVHGEARTEGRDDNLPVYCGPMHARIIRPTLETAVEMMVFRDPGLAGEMENRSAVSMAREDARRCR